MFSALLKILATERAALVDFIDLLVREQQMLMDNQTDNLINLAEQKSNSALTLNTCADSRYMLLQQQISNPERESTQLWLANNSPASLPVWLEIIELTQRAQQLNQTNGELIQMKLRHNQQALTVLSNAVNKAEVYGRNGQPNFSPGSGRSLGSG